MKKQSSAEKLASIAESFAAAADYWRAHGGTLEAIRTFQDKAAEYARKAQAATQEAR